MVLSKIYDVVKTVNEDCSLGAITGSALGGYLKPSSSSSMCFSLKGHLCPSYIVWLMRIYIVGCPKMSVGLTNIDFGP